MYYTPLSLIAPPSLPRAYALPPSFSLFHRSSEPTIQNFQIRFCGKVGFGPSAPAAVPHLQRRRRRGALIIVFVGGDGGAGVGRSGVGGRVGVGRHF